MVSWIGTRLFYAIFFFFLGAWVASVSPDMTNVLRQTSEAGVQGLQKLRGLTLSTFAPASGKPVEKAGETPPAAPAAPTAAPVGGELLVNARAAYAHHDILDSINAYRGYIDRNPNAVEARGELGNVYFSSGRLRDAAQAYFEAAMLKLKSGDIAGAEAFLSAVRDGDAALGDDLKREIAKAESARK